MSESDTSAETTNQPTMVTDNVGIIGVGNFPQADGEEHATTLSLSALKQGVELLDNLGYSDVDVRLAGEEAEEADYPMLLLRPTPGALYADDNAAVTICPKTEKGRHREQGLADDGGDA